MFLKKLRISEALLFYLKNCSADGYLAGNLIKTTKIFYKFDLILIGPFTIEIIVMRNIFFNADLKMM